MRFPPTVLSPEELQLRTDVRDFLAQEWPQDGRELGLGVDSAWDRDFARKVAKRGWLGMVLPKEYGGGEGSAVERFIVAEECLRWGAPVHSYWVADRQTGPVLNKFGTQRQKDFFLPLISQGEIQFSVGMSEPGSGSDLASLRTRADRVEGGWKINGTKIWSTGAQHADYLIVLCRTSVEESKHAGLSQLIVDCATEGLSIRPIARLDGEAEFCEIVFDNVIVPDWLVLGEIGKGWEQNSSELSYERSGPDRWLSTYRIVEEVLRGYDKDPDIVVSDHSLVVLGKAVARWWGIRNLSLSIARMIDRGGAPAVEASLVKEMGTRFEQDVVEEFLTIVDGEPDLDSPSPLLQLLARCILTSPSFTIRGGTTEILRSVASKGIL